MLSKRRRASSVASNSKEDDIADDSAPDSNSPVIRKKKKLDPSELCQQLYDSIRNHKKEDGTMLCDTFIRAPKRRQEPSYYEKVENPIDLLKVQQKLKTDSYEDVDELTCDLELLVKNAKAFYKPSSTEYQDACNLWEIYNANKMKMLDSFGLLADEGPRSKKIGKHPRRSTTQESETSETTEDSELQIKLEELFTAVMTATDPTDESRFLHHEFQLLPSKKIYPEYYDVVDHPIDLKLIATKIQTNAYTNLNEMEKDLLQMAKNACIFNEPKSQIYNDAKTLKRIFTNRKVEIECSKVKLNSTKRRGYVSHSKEIAAIKDDPESSDEDDDRNEKKGEGPMWQLFDHLYNAASASDHPNATGMPLGHSLWKLPHRRFRSEYYEIIKKPISMSQIQSKIKKGEYSTISDLTSDLYLMIDNAKKAYPSSNRVNKDAVKMLRIMNAKLADINASASESDEESEEEDDEEDTPLLPPPPVVVPMAQKNDNETPVPKKKGRPRLHPITPPKSPRSGITNLLKKKLLNLQKYLADFTIENRKPILLFMEKPSKKLYPDYYDVIQHPIDMNTIENNIRYDKYNSIDDVVSDYRLMFSNCRKYNEEGSQIFDDSKILEKALNDKLKEFTSFIGKQVLTPKILKSGKNKSTLEGKLWQLFDAIREYHEPKGNRQLSIIFMKLPSQKDYPDYYDIIKNPIDIEKIEQKLKKQQYESVDELASDFSLMFENACKYNEPDSQIYKDALVLQQVCIQTKQSLRDSDDIPDVSLAIQELLLSLFTSLYNHQDDDGRCFSDSLAELPEYDEMEDGQKIRGISLDLVKRRLDKGSYKRLDIFQEDVFSCFERGRKLSRTDSQVFEDSIELQSFFIKKRDELCKDILSSPAMSYNNLHLSAAVEAVRQSKLLQEEQDQEDTVDTAATHGESMTIDQKVFSPGDFVYFVDSPENKVPGIAYIERLWTNNEGVKMMYANIFLRPLETYHVSSRKFLEQECFKSDRHEPIPMDKVLNKCYVMSVKDYIKYKPDGFADKDIFVCESRYHSRARCFKKIKVWPLVREDDPVKFIPRGKPLELKRVMSVFKERVEKHKGELAELQLQEPLAEKEKPNVVCIVNNGEEGATYYEQFNTVCSGVVKTGDCVYVATQSGKQLIVQVHSLWETADGKSYFQGPWLLTQTELPTPLHKTCHRQELFLSTVVDTNPTVAIVGRCAVLDYAGYSSKRSTEIPESDVYICENIYDEMKKTVCKIQPPNGLKNFSHSQLVTPDEIFHFKRPHKTYRSLRNSITNDDLDMEDSMDGGAASVSSEIMFTSSPAPSIISAPASRRSKSNRPSKVTGYILYSSEHRKGVSLNNPNSKFGDISKLVGLEWKNLPTDVKQAWEDRAVKFNEENSKLFFEEQACASPVPDISRSELFECLWNKCDFQFEEILDCVDHAVAEGIGHVFETYSNQSDPEYHCLWKNCIRLKRQMAAFPSLQRLLKHVRDVHVMKGGKIVDISNRSKNYFPRKSVSYIQNSPTQQQQLPQQQQQSFEVNHQIPISPQQVIYSHQSQVVQAPAPDPIFITVPPRPQRALHSEAYIKYIEGLQQNDNSSPAWEKTLKASQKTLPVADINKLPAHWLGDTTGKTSEEIVNALWHLRNFMMKDVYEINRNCF